MKKKMTVMVLAGMALSLAACGADSKETSGQQSGSTPVIEIEQADEAVGNTPDEQSNDSSRRSEGDEDTDANMTQTSDKADVLTKEQALNAIKNYCYINNPDLKSMEKSDKYTIGWEVTINEAGEIVVLYRSYTAAQIRYYIDPISGDTYVTELVPGIMDEEQRTDESFNLRDYLYVGPVRSSETKSNTGRTDGERFEDEIMLEGMPETVRYEHLINKTAGFELDYEYELLERDSESNTERLISRYDDQKNPVNYLEVKSDAESAETALAKMKESLSGDFDTVTTEKIELSGAGSCVCINASGVKNGEIPAGSMRRVYIIPADDGCILAEAYFTMESAEGFGARFANIVDTIIR